MFNDDTLNIHWSEISELGKVKASASILIPHTAQSNPTVAESTLTFELIERRKKKLHTGLHFLEQLENTL